MQQGFEFAFHRWLANLRMLEIEQIKWVPYVPVSHPFMERLIGTMRRECLDWLIPLNERHLRWILREWVTHYNRGRPHASLGPGMPDPSPELNQLVSAGHHLPERCRVVATPILNGLHHEYRLAREAA